MAKEWRYCDHSSLSLPVGAWREMKTRLNYSDLHWKLIHLEKPSLKHIYCWHYGLGDAHATSMEVILFSVTCGDAYVIIKKNGGVSENFTIKQKSMCIKWKHDLV